MIPAARLVGRKGVPNQAQYFWKIALEWLSLRPRVVTHQCDRHDSQSHKNSLGSSELFRATLGQSHELDIGGVRYVFTYHFNFKVILTMSVPTPRRTMSAIAAAVA